MVLSILLAIFIVAGVAYVARWHTKRESRRRRITETLDKAEGGDKRAMLQLGLEPEWARKYAREFDLDDRRACIVRLFYEEVKAYSGVNDWVAHNLEFPTFADFVGLRHFRELQQNELSFWLAGALRLQDQLGIAICLAYCSQWPWFCKEEVGDSLYAEAVKMREAYTAKAKAEKRMATA